jgi:hypothetical protein
MQEPERDPKRDFHVDRIPSDSPFLIVAMRAASQRPSLRLVFRLSLVTVSLSINSRALSISTREVTILRAMRAGAS